LSKLCRSAHHAKRVNVRARLWGIKEAEVPKNQGLAAIKITRIRAVVSSVVRRAILWASRTATKASAGFMSQGAPIKMPRDKKAGHPGGVVENQ